eukprot:6177174-Amphidinium_carterae.1
MIQWSTIEACDELHAHATRSGSTLLDNVVLRASRQASTTAQSLSSAEIPSEVAVPQDGTSDPTLFRVRSE